MPTDPPNVNPSTAAPHGKAAPSPAHPSHQPHHRSLPHQRHLRFPQPPQNLLQPHNPIPLSHHAQPQHIPAQYASLTSARNIPPMQQPGLSQPPQIPQQQPQQQQPRQHPRPNLNPHQQPPQQPYYVNGGYPGLNAYNPQVAAQYGINTNYVFTPQATYYNGIQPQGAHQQSAPHNPRQRSYTRNVPPQPVAHTHQTRVTVPTVEKQILAIVDPDTNEEVKVDSVDKKSTARTPSSPAVKPAVKIPTRTPRPLELVPDPADVVRKQDASDKVSHTPLPLKNDPDQVTTPPPKDIVSENKKDSVPTADTTSSAQATGKPAVRASPLTTTTESQTRLTSSTSVTPSSPVPKAEAKAIAEKGTLKPPVSIPSAPPGVAESTPDAESVSSRSTSATAQSDEPAPPTSTLASAKTSVVSVRTSESTKAAPPTTGEAISQRSPRVSTNTIIKSGSTTAVPSQPVAPKASVQPAQEKSDTVVETEEDPEPESTSSFPIVTFEEGQRRVYPPALSGAIRDTVSQERDAIYRAILTGRNLLKGGAPPAGSEGYQRGAQSRRSGGSAPASNDGRWARNPQPQSSSRYSVSRGAPTPVVGGGVGSYDPFDLRSARSQNPPPAPKAQPSHGRSNQDPRVSRARLDGPTRGGHGPIDPFISVGPPVEKLKRSENGWKRNKESDDVVTSKVKQIRSLLNKLTLEKFDKIFKQIIDINISSYEILTGVVKEVFEKALFEPKFSGMYAELCVRLDIATRDMLQKASIVDDKGKPIFFRNILLNNCRDEFIRFAKSSETTEKEEQDDKALATESKSDSTEDASSKDEKKPLTAKEKAQRAAANATKAKRRMLANVRFIGELFLKDLLREQIIHKQCIQRLLTIGIESREEDVLEALCKLLSKTGAKLSQNRDANQHIDNYFKPLQTMSRDHTLPARVRFMLQDLIEQRQNNWKVRREEVGAKTISEIHKDIEKEERAKAEAQAAARERRGRGGSMPSRDRGPPNFQRPSMTMARRPKTSGSVSRSALMLEKHGSMPPTNKLHNMNVRLGPDTSKSNTASLRPGGSRQSYGAFGPLGESRDSSSNVQSGDARRLAGMDKRVTSSRRPTPIRPAPVVEDKPKAMEPEVLKRKSRSIVREYWSIGLMGEAKECVEGEVKSVNYLGFLQEIIKFSLAAKIQDRLKTIPLLLGLLGETIPASVYISAFSSIIAELSDIEMDDPRASEFVAKYVAATATSGKLTTEKSDAFGLDFLKKSLPAIGDLKRESKFIILTLAGVYENLSKTVPDEEQRKADLLSVLDVLEVDLPTKMSAWNAQIGMKSLDSMLKSSGISFIVPLLPLELRLKEVLGGSPSPGIVKEVFSTTNLSKEHLQSSSFMKMVIRASFDWLFMNPPSSVKDVFVEIVGKPLVQCFNGEVSRDVQMAALLEAQSFIISNLDILPAHQEGDYDKPGSIAFDSLYFADVVEEDTFLGWREDTGKSTEVEGKDKMIMQTSAFFRWLETAEEE